VELPASRLFSFHHPDPSIPRFYFALLCIRSELDPRSFNPNASQKPKATTVLYEVQLDLSETKAFSLWLVGRVSAKKRKVVSKLSITLACPEVENADKGTQSGTGSPRVMSGKQTSGEQPILAMEHQKTALFRAKPSISYRIVRVCLPDITLGLLAPRCVPLSAFSTSGQAKQLGKILKIFIFSEDEPPKSQYRKPFICDKSI
jgi:hypothetical protein